MKAMPSNSNCRNTGALFSCKVCRRTFNTERALLEHDRDTTKHEPQLPENRMFPPMRRSKTLDQVLNGYYNSVFNESTDDLAEWPSGKPGACYRDVLGEVTSEDTWRRHMKFAEVLGAAISLDKRYISSISREIVEPETTSGPLEDCNDDVCTNYALGRGSISGDRKRICNRPIVRRNFRAFVRDEISATEEAADSCPICHHGLSHTCLWCDTCQANQQEQYSAPDGNGSCPVCRNRLMCW